MEEDITSEERDGFHGLESELLGWVADKLNARCEPGPLAATLLRASALLMVMAGLTEPGSDKLYADAAATAFERMKQDYEKHVARLAAAKGRPS